MLETKLNLKFVRLLQSIAKIEEDPDFRSKKYVIVDEADKALYKASDDPRATRVTLKHPDNVIVVASSTSPAPSAAKGELRFTSLTDANCRALTLSKRGVKGCSIVVYPGFYINPDLEVMANVNGVIHSKLQKKPYYNVWRG